MNAGCHHNEIALGLDRDVRDIERPFRDDLLPSGIQMHEAVTDVDATLDKRTDVDPDTAVGRHGGPQDPIDDRTSNVGAEEELGPGGIEPSDHCIELS